MHCSIGGERGARRRSSRPRLKRSSNFSSSKSCATRSSAISATACASASTSAGRSRALHSGHPRCPQDSDRAGRARYGSRHGHLRHRDGARLRPRHRRRHAGAGAGQRSRRRRLSGCRMTTQVYRAMPVDDARTSRGRTLPQILRDRARENGDDVAIRRKRFVVWRGRPWAEVNASVRRYALGLAAAVIERSDVVAIIAENCEEQFILQLAALCVGARTVCAYPDSIADEIGFLLDHAEAAIAVAQDQEQIDKVLSLASRLPKLRRMFYIEPRGLWHYDSPLLAPLTALVNSGDQAGERWLDAAIDSAAP